MDLRLGHGRRAHRGARRGAEEARDQGRSGGGARPAPHERVLAHNAGSGGWRPNSKQQTANSTSVHQYISALHACTYILHVLRTSDFSDEISLISAGPKIAMCMVSLGYTKDELRIVNKLQLSITITKCTMYKVL